WCGCVIDILTGYVVDFQVMSKFCCVCKLTAKDLGAESPEFNIWIEDHSEVCEIYHIECCSVVVGMITYLWCPKEIFVSKRHVAIAVGQAVCDYNHGTTYTTTKTQETAGMSPGTITIALGAMRDSERKRHGER
ncbi:hypothetical protein ANN_26187, partial [Periplaneta americana]